MVLAGRTKLKSFQKLFVGGYLFVFVEYLCKRSPKIETKNIKNYSSILAIVNHRNRLDDLPPLNTPIDFAFSPCLRGSTTTDHNKLTATQLIANVCCQFAEVSWLDLYLTKIDYAGQYITITIKKSIHLVFHECSPAIHFSILLIQLMNLI